MRRLSVVLAVCAGCAANVEPGPGDVDATYTGEVIELVNGELSERIPADAGVVRSAADRLVLDHVFVAGCSIPVRSAEYFAGHHVECDGARVFEVVAIEYPDEPVGHPDFVDIRLSMIRDGAEVKWEFYGTGE